MKKNKFVTVLSLTLFLCCTFSMNVTAQNNYSIDITKVNTEVKRGHLDLG